MRAGQEDTIRKCGWCVEKIQVGGHVQWGWPHMKREIAAHEIRIPAHDHHVCAANPDSRAGTAISCAANQQ